mgnify:CR=1 FL=1
MKNLLIALAILPLFATGQGYKPFINTESRWIIGALFEKRYVNQEQEVENEATTNQLLFFYDGDSIVENSSYHKIMFTCGIKTERIRDWEGFLISENESWAPCDTQLFALIREDTTLRKVFVVESSVQFLDSCNRLLSNSFFDDPDARDNERILMNFNLMDPTFIDSTVVINGWYRNLLNGLEKYYIFNIEDTAQVQTLLIDSKSYYLNEEEIGVNASFYSSALSKEIGYYGNVFHPLGGCYLDDWRAESFNFCFSIGDNRKNGASEYYYEPNKPCELLKPNSIKEHGELRRKPFVLNPVEDNTLHFYQPIYGELVVQDARGAVVVQQKLTGKTEVPLGETESGIYLVQVHTANGSYLFDRVLVK